MNKKGKVKVPTARQLPSGNWFVQLRINGKSISITEPTERAAVARAMAIKDGIIQENVNAKVFMLFWDVNVCL
jgi:hypothetical protein